MFAKDSPVLGSSFIYGRHIFSLTSIMILPLILKFDIKNKIIKKESRKV